MHAARLVICTGVYRLVIVRQRYVKAAWAQFLRQRGHTGSCTLHHCTVSHTRQHRHEPGRRHRHRQRRPQSRSQDTTNTATGKATPQPQAGRPQNHRPYHNHMHPHRRPHLARCHTGERRFEYESSKVSLHTPRRRHHHRSDAQRTAASTASAAVPLLTSPTPGMPCLQIHDLIICIAVARCHGKLMLGAATRTAPHSGRRGVTEPRRPTDAAPPTTSRAHRLPPMHLIWRCSWRFLLFGLV